MSDTLAPEPIEDLAIRLARWNEYCGAILNERLRQRREVAEQLPVDEAARICPVFRTITGRAG